MAMEQTSNVGEKAGVIESRRLSVIERINEGRVKMCD
jgi:hypothetical protein